MSLKNWEKVRHVSPGWSTFWGESLIKQIEKSDKLIKNSSKKFASREILEEFKNYVGNDLELETNRGKAKISEIDENDIITTSWDEIKDIFVKSRKIYGRNNDSCAFQNEDALCFLQSIISDNFFHNIEHQAGETFELNE
jgi:hypothetical protein